MNRRQALEEIMAFLGDGDIALFTTGKISREAFRIQDRKANFYMVGSMGLISSFSLGVAYACPEKQVLIFDGDGSAFMNLGSLAMVSRSKLANITHIILDNGVYASTGNQKCISSEIDISALANALQYKWVKTVADVEDLRICLKYLKRKRGPRFLRVMIDTIEGVSPPRIGISPLRITRRFQSAIRQLSIR
ncbi:MAG: thiamine pyrophosphate-dependent enzyme [Candidatus Omnitrophica bacterium]|nr:thiamine pyrophosphate-dependent enzyme [Candidatus Omnitrophota bacterium]